MTSAMKTYRAAELKRYSLEVYLRSAPEALVWKVDSDDPFTPMNVGDRILPMDAPGARQDEVFEILAVEHLLWTAGERVRYVTRIYTQPTEPFSG